MFERFTDRSREVVRRARAEAGREAVGTQHLLLAILADPDALATQVLADAGIAADDLRARTARHVDRSAVLGEADAAALRQIGIDLAAIEARLEESFGPGALRRPVPPRRRGWWRRPTGGPFTPRSKKVLELALREALHLKHRHIGTEHILLGLLREGSGLAAQVLREAGVELRDLRRRVEAAVRAVA
ncbi:Clp amino terminal domain-containing protein, pathogenicity island component [Micromonospora pallida]|uniref:Clp amino terminal domain-containing protein, pathogenicity island component n=1 Tax=Micromonospora pallida TaxID=145854 RepID=A0A1C6ST73_9ACTN|nr:Clp protease N-terminal domain-containing protein [Micromonospora pallida]SCL32710.1 Clp amino terminal domain-containing protein, pathogenicity island component [Micromonospora pallida]